MERKFNVGDIVRINSNEEDAYNGRVVVIDSIFTVSGAVLYSVVIDEDTYTLYGAESPWKKWRNKMDLVKKFETLKSKLESTKLELAKAETNLDIVTKQREKALKELLDLTGAKHFRRSDCKETSLKV